MKHSGILRALIAAIIFLITLSPASAQRTGRQVPRWLSTKGYWVVETNGSNKREHIVRFYTNDNRLVYLESLSGVSLKTSKRSVKMKLKKVLETSIAVWEVKKQQSENLALLAGKL